MYKILLVDDEKEIRNIIKQYAEYSGFEVIEASDGVEAVKAVQNCVFDVIIMDLMMPQMDGFSAIKEIKKIAPDVPTIILSAKDGEYSKLFGFEIGVDDYVTKPFSTRELFARINALLKRTSNAQKREELVKVSDSLLINTVSHEVIVDGEKADVTLKEYELLLYFVRNKGVALTRDQLLQHVWGYQGAGYDRTVDTHVKMLRNSLGKYRDSIITLRGVGYKFEL